MKPLSLTKPGKTGRHTGSGGLAAEFTSTRDAFDELEKRQKELEQLWASLTGYHEMVQRLTVLEAGNLELHQLLKREREKRHHQFSGVDKTLSKHRWDEHDNLEAKVDAPGKHTCKFTNSCVCYPCGHIHEGRKGCYVAPKSPDTCGECVLPYWRTLDDFGVCTACSTHFDRDYCPIGKDSKICDNFKR